MELNIQQKFNDRTDYFNTVDTSRLKVGKHISKSIKFNKWASKVWLAQSDILKSNVKISN